MTVLAASTFVEVLVVLFIFIPLIMMWGFALVDLFIRRDLSGGGTALWLLLIIVLPVFGALIYLAARPAPADSQARRD